ncbi:unnamed protein product [Linum tenue]|uniref:Phosphate transporter n=2 Tax=Linum tenue TaxID=586396 RepID=A0AAV0PXI2_9ROSI|nr:unnamed protein product [Linum tenue]
MPSREKVTVDLAARVVGNWKETYVWIPILGAFAVVALAFSTGANNIPAPLSTAVGSGALPLFKATIAAFFIYLPGAALSGSNPINSLFSQQFVQDNQPNEAFLMWSMTVVLITAAIWMAMATYFELPVSSQQSMQDALFGTIIGVQGFRYIPIWHKNEYHRFNVVGMAWMVVQWTVAPVVACVCAFCLFTLLKKLVLRHEKGDERILVFLPIGYGIAAGLLCQFVVFEVLRDHLLLNKWVAIGVVALATLIGVLLSLVLAVPLARRRLQIIKDTRGEFDVKDKTLNLNELHKIEIHNLPTSTEAGEAKEDDEKQEVDVEDMLKDFMQMRTLETVYEEEERSIAFSVDSTQQDHDNPSQQSALITSFKQLLECKSEQFERKTSFQIIKETALNNSGWRLIKESAKSVICPAVEYDRPTLIRHALAEKYDELEDLFWLLHLVASCIFALIQSSTEIGALAGPYGAIIDVGMANNMTWWCRVMGGLVASMGFFFCGWRLTQVLGLKVTYMSNARGMTTQLSAAAAVLIVTRLSLPASCVHAFVGSSVGVGIADNRRNVNWRLVGKLVGGWALTTLFCSGLGYVIFSASIHSPSYVVPETIIIN